MIKEIAHASLREKGVADVRREAQPLRMRSVNSSVHHSSAPASQSFAMSWPSRMETEHSFAQQDVGYCSGRTTSESESISSSSASDTSPSTERRRRFDINAAYGGPKVTVLCDVPRSDPIFHTPDLRLKVEFFDDRLFLTDMGVGGVHGGVVADVGSQLEVIREREHLSDLIRTETSYEYSIDDILQPDISVSRNGVYLPYLMVEVAVSETLAHATRKAKKYFQLDTSEVQVVLVISVGRFVQGDETSLKSLKALVFRRDDVEHPTVTSFMRGENYSSLALEGPYVLDLEKVRMSVYDEISQPPPPKK